MDRACLRLVTNEGKPVSRPLRALALSTPKPDTLVEVEAVVVAASAVHDVIRRLQQAIVDGDQVAIRAYARSAEFRAERGVRMAEKLRDLHTCAAG